MSNQQSFSRFLSEDHSLAERLAFIDFKLRYTGQVNRSDLKNMFGLAEATASKAMSAYTEVRPNNMTYDRALRANAIVRESFDPLFAIDAETGLEMLAEGFNKSKLLKVSTLPYTKIGHIPDRLNIRDVVRVTRAIANNYAVKCIYFSENSDNHGERILVPTAIMFDGKFWIFRAYDRGDSSEEGKFKHFNFSRIAQVEELVSDHQKSHEELALDSEWNNQIPLMLKIHDDLDGSIKNTVRRDFGMAKEQDDLLITAKEASLWILTKQWYIDARSDEQIKKDEEKIKNRDKKKSFFKFKLTNRDMVEAMKTV